MDEEIAEIEGLESERPLGINSVKAGVRFGAQPQIIEEVMDNIEDLEDIEAPPTPPATSFITSFSATDEPFDNTNGSVGSSIAAARAALRVQDHLTTGRPPSGVSDIIDEELEESPEDICFRNDDGKPVTLRLFRLLARGSSGAVHQAIEVGGSLSDDDLRTSFAVKSIMLRADGSKGHPPLSVVDEHDVSDSDNDTNSGGTDTAAWVASLNYDKIAMLKREIAPLARLWHRKRPAGILPYVAVHMHEDNLYLVMQHCAGGSLSSLMSHLGHGLPLPIVEVITYQLLQGLEAIHNEGIGHRDVSCGNILFDLSPREASEDESRKPWAITKLRAFLAGFGSHLTNTMASSLSMSSSKEHDVLRSPTRTARPADIWRLGCTVLEMLAGKALHPTHRNVSLGTPLRPPMPEASSIHGSPDSLPEGFSAFMDGAFEPNTRDRATAKELLDTPWMKSVADRLQKMRENPDGLGMLKDDSASRVVLDKMFTGFIERQRALGLEAAKAHEAAARRPSVVSLEGVKASTSATFVNFNAKPGASSSGTAAPVPLKGRGFSVDGGEPAKPRGERRAIRQVNVNSVDSAAPNSARNERPGQSLITPRRVIGN